MSEGRCGMEAADLSRAGWRKSSYSAQNGNCVEVGMGGLTVVVRDTRALPGAVLEFGPHAWRRFAARIRDAGKA
jgi:hypothetical protein